MKKVLALDRSTVKVLKDQLKLLGNIREQTQYGFKGISDLAKLKRFVYYAIKLSYVTSDIWDFPNLTGLWKTLVELTSDSPDFHLQSEKLLAFRKAYLSLSKSIGDRMKMLKRAIEEELSINLRGEEFTCESKVAERLIERNLVEVVRKSDERYHLRIRRTEDVERLNKELEKVEEQMRDEEEVILEKIARIAAENSQLLKSCEKVVEEVDLDLCRYDFFFQMNCSIPEISERFEIKNGRFPPVVEYCNRNGYEYYPVTLEANKGVTILYGPNMGGKTTLLRTIGSFVVLMHLGFPVPCEFFSSPLFVHVRALSKGDELGLSSFAKEISSLVEIMRLDERKLILIDEFGSTTNPVEGESLALAVINYLNSSDDFVFFTTHYPAVVKKAAKAYMCGKLKDLAAQDPHKMIDFSLEKGKSLNQTVAILLAERFGLPKQVVEFAQKLLKKDDLFGENSHGQ